MPKYLPGSLIDVAKEEDFFGTLDAIENNIHSIMPGQTRDLRPISKWNEKAGYARALAKCIYDRDCDEVGTLRRMQPSDFGLKNSHLVNSKTGLRSAIFANDDDIFVVYAGTTPTSPADWNNNFRQGLGLGSKQYDAASRVANDLAKLYGIENVYFAGHSLGGGLAALSGALTGAETHTFNAAGVNDNTLARHGYVGDDFDNITNHISRGDILSEIQEGTLAPKAIGNQKYYGGRINYLGGPLWGVLRHGEY